MEKITIKTLTVMGSLALAGLPVLADAAVPEHANIVLKDATGANIPVGGTAAFSYKQTCGTTGCHDGAGPGVLDYSYDDMERHSIHTQLGANQFYGFNPWNPDHTNAYLTGEATQGKNWVQGAGHVGKW